MKAFVIFLAILLLGVTCHLVADQSYVIMDSDGNIYHMNVDDEGVESSVGMVSFFGMVATLFYLLLRS